MDDLLSVQQAAKELDLSKTQIRRLCQESRLGCFKLPGGRDWLIPRTAVEEYQRTRRKPGRPPKANDDYGNNSDNP